MTEPTRPTPLKFETEKGAARAGWIAVILVAALVGWMGSGMLAPGDDNTETAAPEAEPAADQAVALVRVGVLSSEAQSITEVFLAEGQAEPQRDSAIRGERGGQVIEITAPKGSDVAAGDVVARLDGTQAKADLARARASLSEAERDFNTAETLLERGVATVERVSQARAALASAQANFTAAQENADKLEITAPFTGRIEALSIETGELIAAGGPVGRIVDLDPLTVSIQVPQQSIGELKVGQVAEVEFITGVTRRGEVSFVGTSAATETRTFAAEVTIDNADMAIPAGLSAQVRIPTGETQAHFLSPAILSLGGDGALGVKAVGAENKVDFHPISILRAQTDGVWVSGLPDTLEVIVIGQGFVNAGEVVEPVAEAQLTLAASAPRTGDTAPAELATGASPIPAANAAPAPGEGPATTEEEG